MDVGWHEQGLDLTVKQERNVPVGAHFTIFHTWVEPAVLAKSEIAARGLIKEHPSINNSSISLKTNAHDPSQNVEGNEGDIDHPDEESCTESAPPYEQSEPNPVKKPINGCN